MHVIKSYVMQRMGWARRCRSCGRSELRRSKDNKVVAGVVGALASYFGIRTAVLRALFLALVIWSIYRGNVFLVMGVYVLLALLIPAATDRGPRCPRCKGGTVGVQESVLSRTILLGSWNNRKFSVERRKTSDARELKQELFCDSCRMSFPVPKGFQIASPRHEREEEGPEDV